jgi:hypothetical protein
MSSLMPAREESDAWAGFFSINATSITAGEWESATEITLTPEGEATPPT